MIWFDGEITKGLSAQKQLATGWIFLLSESRHAMWMSEE